MKRTLWRLIIFSIIYQLWMHETPVIFNLIKMPYKLIHFFFKSNVVVEYKLNNEYTNHCKYLVPFPWWSEAIYTELPDNRAPFGLFWTVATRQRNTRQPMALLGHSGINESAISDAGIGELDWVIPRTQLKIDLRRHGIACHVFRLLPSGHAW